MNAVCVCVYPFDGIYGWGKFGGRLIRRQLHCLMWILNTKWTMEKWWWCNWIWCLKWRQQHKIWQFQQMQRLNIKKGEIFLRLLSETGVSQVQCKTRQDEIELWNDISFTFLSMNLRRGWEIMGRGEKRKIKERQPKNEERGKESVSESKRHREKEYIK